MSQPITWADAQSYASTYQNDSNAFKNANNDVLKGFSVDANHVKTILGLSGMPTVPTLFIIMGINPAGEFTPVITAIDGNNNITTGVVFDMAMPCPSACPNNF